MCILECSYYFRQPWQKIPLGLTINLPAKALDEGSDIDFFLEGSTLRKILSIFVKTPATNITRILAAYFCHVHDALQRFRTCQLAKLTGLEP